MEQIYLVSLAAVIVALALGIAGIYENRRMLQNEIKRRQLREIIDFAVEIDSYMLFELKGQKASDLNDMAQLWLDLQSKFMAVMGRAEYIAILTFGFGNTLEKKVADFVLYITEHSRNIKETLKLVEALDDEYREDGIFNRIRFVEDMKDPSKLQEFRQIGDKLDDSKQLIAKSASEVIFEAGFILKSIK